MLPPPVHSGSRGGFTLVEVMVSITVLFLGVITAGGLMITVQRGANFTENRYRDYADLRARVESLKAQVSASTLQPATTTLLFPPQFTTTSGHAGQTQCELNAAGIPSLVWVQMVVAQENGAGPIQFMTYLRVNE
jgi:type II secretory pathway component PulJ